MHGRYRSFSQAAHCQTNKYTDTVVTSAGNMTTANTCKAMNLKDLQHLLYTIMRADGMQISKAFQKQQIETLSYSFAMCVCTWTSGGLRGFQLLALSWWSSSNFRLMFSIESWSISQKPARSWEMGRGFALGFYCTHMYMDTHKHTQ